MRGGIARWKRGVASQGVRQALDYAFGGTCDSHMTASAGAEAAAGYTDGVMERFVMEVETPKSVPLTTSRLTSRSPLSATSQVSLHQRVRPWVTLARSFPAQPELLRPSKKLSKQLG